MKIGIFTLLSWCAAASAQPFDGSKWNVSTGNLSVSYIQASPIGAHPRPLDFEPPPTVEAMAKMKEASLVAYEDYIAWGAVEREEGKWNFSQHDKVEEAVHKAGLHYVIYDWVHFPPVWLRESKRVTLMKCVEHNQETNYVSIFDPKTLEYYDRFYKAVSEHFGNKIDGIYACILGPYGEGNYPLLVPDWVNIGHCHEGYWCADEFGIKAFAAAMQKKYGDVAALNTAWGASLKSFDEVRPPKEISEKFKPTPEAFPSPHDKRRWLDFITWYHQAIIDFAEESIKITLKYFPKEKVRTKPGGNAGGVNPIAWGTYCPGYAKMAKPYGVVLQPADCQGAVFGDKWVGTSYQFYNVPLSTEPAGNLDGKGFVRRMFSDASSGAAQLFTYEFEKHAADIREYIHLYTGKPGETEIAVLCPTTLYRLGGDLKPTIEAGRKLRDLCEFDVLDELLIADGALTPEKYKVLILTQPETIDQPILDKLATYREAGGKIILLGNVGVANVEGQEWPFASRLPRVPDLKSKTWLADLAKLLADYKGCDGQLDGVWTCRRGDQLFMLNTTDKPVKIADVEIPPHVIWEKK